MIALACALVSAACGESKDGTPTPVAATDIGGALQVAMMDPAYQGFDPQTSFTQ